MSMNNLKQFAIVIPGAGGPRDADDPAESLPEWTKIRLDWVIRIYGNSDVPVVVLSSGTYHKSGVLDKNSKNWSECTAMAMYLRDHKFDIRRVYEENLSYDTIGNAFFFRTTHAQLRDWSSLLVVVNEFHYPRVKAIFDWIFGLPWSPPVETDSKVKAAIEWIFGISTTVSTETKWYIDYHVIPDSDLNPELASVIKARKEREQRSLKQLQETVREIDAKSMVDVHEWLFSKHDLYSSGSKIKLSTDPRPPMTDTDCLNSY